jgi:hypothetical protein
MKSPRPSTRKALKHLASEIEDVFIFSENYERCLVRAAERRPCPSPERTADIVETVRATLDSLLSDFDRKTRAAMRSGHVGEVKAACRRTQTATDAVIGAAFGEVLAISRGAR